MKTKKPSTLGSRLRKAREAKKLSRPALARLIDRSAENVRQHENDKAQPGADVLSAYSKHLGISIDELVNGSPSPRVRT